MPYTKTTWSDEVPATTPIKYRVTDDSLGVVANSATIALVTSVTAGTAVNATNLNKIETGIETAQATAETAIADAAAAEISAAAAIPKSLVTAIGDLIYSTGAGLVARLARPAVRSFLQNTSTGAVSWETLFGLHAKAIGIYDPDDHDITSTTYVDIINATLNIVTTRTCTILMIATGRMGIDTGGAAKALAQPVINGYAPATDAGAAQQSSAGVGMYPYTVLHYRTGITAGTITCKIQGKRSGGTHAYYGAGTIILLAIEE